MPLIADILVQTNCDKHAEFLKWYATLSVSQKRKTQRLKPITVVLKVFCLPDNIIDIDKLNAHCLYRVLRELGYEGSKYKDAKNNQSVKIIEILSSRKTNGY